ncbi:hypothetical protein B0H17DRAFT_1093497 [Mycena rosella]|uniref:FAD/NAD(P)-binding domain-containing protein n=1 Tax=Mycena rosella TaxID=1033263 RepID=A0AAD7G776_MYCRO|nr:hypothetical protein B0H17DRAFT_1093497 [Mycena rosella]
MMHVPNLPTLDKLNVTVPPDLDVNKVAAQWMASFSFAVEAGNVGGIMSLFIDESHWRDMLALTWDFRTFNGAASIQQFLADRLVPAHLSHFRINDEYTALLRPYPDIAWIHVLFDFETQLGLASGIVRLVPQAQGPWKAHCMYTNLEDLKGFPEKIGGLRNPAPNHGEWAHEREHAVAFEDEEPTVLVIGAGHSGLDVAARLKCLGVRALVVERNPRIGDNWRNRYEALCLHDPVWYDHLPYMPFPPTWPVYTPALKLGNWLEHYAEALELDVWTSSNVVSARKNQSGSWDVVVDRAGKERVFTVKHLIFATGIGGGEAKFPAYPGMDVFKGQILHSIEHKRADDHMGKKVVVVGSCTSAHDLAADYYNHGIDVTMYQRSSTYIMSTKSILKHIMGDNYKEGGPPVGIADRVTASFPHLMAIGLGRRQALEIAEDDKEILDGLRKRGFKLNMGTMDAGFPLSAWHRAGGYYLDVGASQMIIDGKIKLKNDSQLAEFTPSGLKFEDGSELPADVVVFATGLGDARNTCKQIWGLDEEGEIHGSWRDIGVPGLWYMMEIKAMEEGLFGARYSAAK